MSEENNVVLGSNPKWLEDVLDTVDDMLADPKKVSFNTHKNRKGFSGKIRSLVIDAYRSNCMVKTHTEPEPQPLTTSTHKDCIARIHNNAPVGSAVMTPQLSSAGDDILGVGLNPDPSKAMKRMIEKPQPRPHGPYDNSTRSW